MYKNGQAHYFFHMSFSQLLNDVEKELKNMGEFSSEKFHPWKNEDKSRKNKEQYAMMKVNKKFKFNGVNKKVEDILIYVDNDNRNEASKIIVASDRKKKFCSERTILESAKFSPNTTIYIYTYFEPCELCAEALLGVAKNGHTVIVGYTKDFDDVKRHGKAKAIFQNNVRLINSNPK